MTKKKKFINELRHGDIIDEFFILTKARQGTSKNGPYWYLELQDRTGKIPGKIWYPVSKQYPSIQEESFVKIQGQVDSFRDNLQIIVNKLSLLDQQEISWSDFLPSTTTPPEVLLKELEDLCFKNLKYKPWKKFCGLILRDENLREKFISAPAAKNIHHAYRGGLLEHTLNVCKICLKIADLYPDLDREILVVGALLHDIGKIEEFSGDISPDYTDKGHLLGHIVLGINIIETFLKKVTDLDQGLILHLKHIIISHHGEYEFGSPKRPKTKEAMVLHFADNLDSKMNLMNSMIQEINQDEDNWTKYQRALGRRIFNPPHTQEFIQDKEKQKKRSIKECLLPLKG